MPVKYVAAPNNTDFGLPFSKLKYDTLLATDVEQTLTIPATAPKYKAVFSFASGEDVWVAVNATATKAGAAFAATDSELNPRCREVRKDDVLHFITGGSGAEVSVTLYALNTIS